MQEVVGIRGNPHVLVVGDPGLGKSQVGWDTCSFTSNNNSIVFVTDQNFTDWL